MHRQADDHYVRLKRNELGINFECKKCGSIFDCDVGKITLPENPSRSYAEKNIVCPMCGQRSIDEVLLTELGQSQLTRATFELEAGVTFNFKNEALELIAPIKGSQKKSKKNKRKRKRSGKRR